MMQPRLTVITAALQIFDRLQMPQVRDATCATPEPKPAGARSTSGSTNPGSALGRNRQEREPRKIIRLMRLICLLSMW